MTRLAALVGLAREASLLRRASGLDEDRLHIAVGGAADPLRTRRAVEAVLSGQPDAVVSFGLAGGLSPDLDAGALVCPRKIFAPGGFVHAVDEGLWTQFTDRIYPFPVAECSLAGSDEAVTTTDAKQALRQTTSACAVDMESHLLAESAALKGVPLLVVRAVCDPAHQAIPQPVVRLMDAEGRLHWRGLPAALPYWRAIAALARHSRRAEHSLERAARALRDLE